MEADSLVHDELRGWVREYVGLDDEEARLRRAHAVIVKDLKARKDALKRKIMPIMSSTEGLQRIGLSEGGALACVVSKRTETLKPDHIMEELRALVSAQEAQEALENMNRRRAVSEESVLKRTRARAVRKD